MASKPFDISRIRKADNPFSSTHSTSIGDGVFIKDIEEINDKKYYADPRTKLAVNLGLLKNLDNILSEINQTSVPKHVMILAAYGQGKSFSIKYIQDNIYSKYGDPIISHSIGNDADKILERKNDFTKQILSDLKLAYDNLDPKIFKNKCEYKPKKITTSLKNSLKEFDNIFFNLKVRVYIFIDELDKVITASENIKIKNFIDELKSIADECNAAISLWISGTTNCKVIMDNLGPDYTQRFTMVEYCTFNSDETVEYINQKCKQIVDLVSYIPFDSFTKKRIYEFSDGNIRYIEKLCGELWSFAVDKGKRIDRNLWEQFISNKLNEPIKTILGSTLSNNIIMTMKKLVLKDKASSHALFFGLRQRQQNEIRDFIDNNDKIKKFGRSYKLETDIRNKILNLMLGKQENV